MTYRIFALFAFCLAFYSTTFAFEGVIEQEVFVASTGSTAKVVWHFKGTKVKMELQSSTGEDVTMIVDSETNKVLLYNDAIEDENGNKLYMELGPDDINSSIGAISTGKMAESSYQGKPSKTVEVLNNGTKYTVEYLPSIDIDFSDFAAFFKESMEIQALVVLDEIGFPVQTSQKVGDGKVKTVLKTTSYSEKVVAATEFLVPAGFKKFELPAQN